jgi:hypothetical protein
MIIERQRGDPTVAAAVQMSESVHIRQKRAGGVIALGRIEFGRKTEAVAWRMTR